MQRKDVLKTINRYALFALFILLILPLCSSSESDRNRYCQRIKGATHTLESIREETIYYKTQDGQWVEEERQENYASFDGLGRYRETRYGSTIDKNAFLQNRYTYDENRILIQTSLQSNGAVDRGVKIIRQGQKISTREVLDASEQLLGKTDYTYDDQGRIREEKTTNASGLVKVHTRYDYAQNRKESLHYDFFGNPDKRTVSDLSEKEELSNYEQYLANNVLAASQSVHQSTEENGFQESIRSVKNLGQRNFGKNEINIVNTARMYDRYRRLLRETVTIQNTLNKAEFTKNVLCSWNKDNSHTRIESTLDSNPRKPTTQNTTALHPRYTVTEIDPDGNILKRSNYIDQDLPQNLLSEESSQYTFDSYGNWIKNETLSLGKVGNQMVPKWKIVIMRTLTYFEDSNASK